VPPSSGPLSVPFESRHHGRDAEPAAAKSPKAAVLPGVRKTNNEMVQRHGRRCNHRPPPLSSLTTGTGSSGTVRLGHINPQAPHPIRTAKLSLVELAAHGTTDHGAGPSAPTEREETASFRTRPQDTCSRATSGHVTTPLFLIYSAAGHHPRDAGQRRRAVPASRGVPACSPADPSSLPGHRHGDGCKREDSGRTFDSLGSGVCSARRWKTGRRAVRSFDPYYSLTLMLELRGPDYSRSPTPRVV
jgi:hypothetical protein